MKKTIGKHEFWEEFREIRPDNFSYEGLQALYEYLEEYEEDSSEEIELDVIAICCEYSEYATAQEAALYYDWKPDEDEETNEETAIEYLEYNTSIIVFPGGVIIQDY